MLFPASAAIFEMRAARVPGHRNRGEAQLADAAGEGVPRGARARDGIERRGEVRGDDVLFGVVEHRPHSSPHREVDEALAALRPLLRPGTCRPYLTLTPVKARYPCC